MAELRSESRRSGRPKIGVALAGGGPEGAVYEIGALLALQEAIEGVDFNDGHIYVGVSAGAFLSSCLANGFTPEELCRALVSADESTGPFTPETFFTPGIKEFAHRLAMLPRLLGESFWDYFTHPRDLTLLEALTRMSRGLPVGVFDSEPIHAYLQNLFEDAGRTNDFRELKRHLVVVAADLDSGDAARFGEPGMDHVPISRAVQASTALPGVYSPVLIDGRYYVDGVLIKTLHASVALDAGADLVFCINPLVPVDTARAVEAGIMRRGKLVDRGLPSVLEQSLRTMIRSRLQAGMASYKDRYKGSDVLLFEPRRDDYRMFFTNIFSFSQRQAVCEHAYRRTRRNLRARRSELEPILERHGLRLREEVLEDPTRQVWALMGEEKETHRARPGTPLATFERLDRVLTRLERLVDEQAGRAPSPEEEDDPVRDALEERDKPRLRLIKAG